MNTHTEIATVSARIEASWRVRIDRIRFVLSDARNAFRRSRQRRLAIRELQAMPDRLLLDMGLTRNNIPEVVDGMLAKQAYAAFPATKRAETERTASRDSGACKACV